MGVKQLLKFIKENEILKEVKLSLLAEQVFNETWKKPKLLCDFLNSMEWFWRPPVQALIRSHDYPEYTTMYGGDFHLFAERIHCFVEAFEFIGIEPIFFVDGPKGTDERFEGKIPVLKHRHESKLQSIEIMQQVCKGSLPTYQDIHCQHSTIVRQLLLTLLKAEAKVVFCSGEADPEIMKYAQSHEETCGVLSSNMNFAITSGTVMFPVEFFDVEGTLKLNGVLIDNSPIEIVCKVVCPRDVATYLGIRENQLPDLAALCGNDYTRDILKRFSVLTKLGVEGSDIDSVAAWLRDKEMVLLDFEPMRDLCIEYPELRIAIERSYSNYTVGSPPSSCDPEVEYASRLYPVIEQETVSGTGMRDFLSVTKHGIHWRALCFESITLGDPCFSDVLLPVRKSMYTLLGVREVTEYGRTQHHTFDQIVVPVCVSPSEVDVGIRCFHTLRELHPEAKLVGLYQFMTQAVHVTCTRDVEEIVHKIIGSSHDLPDLTWPKLYQVATLVTCLKVIATLNRVSQPPLGLSDGELDALLLSCLTCSTNGEIPPHMTEVKPSMRTISLGEWFSAVTMCCYRLACLLHLLETQPEPRNIFYPMVFAPYHIALEAKPDLEEKHKVGIDYIRNAMHTALDLPALKAVRYELFYDDRMQPLSQLAFKFLAAQSEIETIQRHLLPRITTPDLMELALFDSEDEMPALKCQLDSNSTSASSSGDQSEGSFKGATNHSTHASDANPRGMLPSTYGECSDYDSDVEEALQTRKQPPAFYQKEKVWHNTSELPIMEHRDKILDLISKFQVVCIEGETGCGKSSQVPQFILQEAFTTATPRRVKVLINQPNFIAAKKLAERVAEERRERLGVMVGYCSEVERCPKDRETALTFCTTGYMLQVLQGLQTTPTYTHIILDEIHERSADIDFTLLVVRRLALSSPMVKVILMSATLQGGLFIDYFQDKLGLDRVAFPVFVGIKRFTVKEFCIDELDELITGKEDEVQDDIMKRLQFQLMLGAGPSVLPLIKAEISPFALNVCINLIISQSNPGDTILVFLPGSSDIIDFCDKLQRELRRLCIPERFEIFQFHNQVAREDQQDAFRRPIRGTANVILANRSAESSLTFPDLKLVLNFGVSMVAVYNTKEHITKLTRRWCSRASCIQRAGRVGRVSEGTAVHLFPREFYEKLPDFNPPEIVDAPLAKSILKAKKICYSLNIPRPSLLLGSVIQPPSLLQFEAALHDLVDSGALHHNPQEEISEIADITLLGKFSTSLPLDLNLCRLVLLGILFGCPLDAIIFATALTMYQDVFTLPTKQVMKDTYDFCHSLARSTFSRMKFDDRSYSNPIMMCNMFIEWLRFKHMSRNQYSSRRDLANAFCKKYAVRVGRLLHFETYVGDMARSVMEYIPSGSILHSELQTLARIEQSTDAEPRYFESNFFTGCGTSEPLQRQMSDKYVPPEVRHLRSQLTSESPSLHFCRSYTMLKALIAAATSDSRKFMCGERACDSHNPKIRSKTQRSLQKMQAEVFPTRHSLAMDLTELDIKEEVDTTDQQGIEKFFRSLPHGFCFPVTISADKNTAIVYFRPYPNTSYSMKRIASNIDPSLVTSTGDIPVGSSSGGISILPLESEFFWRFGERRNKFWEIDDVSYSLPAPFHPCALQWYELTESRLHFNTVFMNWRNPTAQMCVLEGPTEPYFAIASNVLSTSRMHSRYATSITLLPRMPKGLFILLAFQPTSSSVELLVDTKLNLVKGIKFNSLQIPCTNSEVYITPRRLNAINRLRKAISTAMTIPLSDGCIPLSDPLIQDIPELLQDVLTPDHGSPTSLHPETRSPHTASTYSPDLVWEMVTPGDLMNSAKPGSLSSLRTHYYPEFRCSLLGTKPYSVKEVQSKVNVFSGMHSLEYTQSTAAKILAKQARMQAAEREGVPILPERINIEEPCVEQGNQDVPSQGHRLPTALKSLGVAEQGHLDSAAVLSEDTTMTRSSTSTATKQTTDVSDGGTHTEKPAASSGEIRKTRHGTSKEQLHTQIGHGRLNPLMSYSNASQAALELHNGNQRARAAITPNTGEDTSVKEAIREQTNGRGDENPSNTTVYESIFVDGSTAFSGAPNKPSTSTPVTVAVAQGMTSTVPHTHRISEMKTSKKQPEALWKDVQHSNTSVGHGSTKPEVDVHCAMKPKESVTSELGGKGTQKSEVPTSGTAGSPKKTTDSTGRQAAFSGAARDEEVVDQVETPERKPTLQPGTDEHLADFLVGVVRRWGGVARLSFIRKKAYPQYFREHRKNGAVPFFKKTFLMKHSELFEVYKDDSGVVFVRLLCGHGGNSKELKSSSEEEVQSTSLAVTPSVQPQTKVDTTIQAMPTQDMKPETGQKRGASKPDGGLAFKPAQTPVVVNRHKNTTSETHKEQVHGEPKQSKLDSVSLEDVTMAHNTSIATVQTNVVSDGGNLSSHNYAAIRPNASENASENEAFREETYSKACEDPFHTTLPKVISVDDKTISSVPHMRENKPSISTPVSVAIAPGSESTESSALMTSEIKGSEAQPEALSEDTHNQGLSNTSVGHDAKKPEVEVHCAMKLKESVTSELGGKGKRKSEVPTSGTASSPNKTTDSTGRQELKPSSEEEVQSTSLAVTPSVQPQAKVDATKQAMPTPDMKSEAGQKRGAFKQKRGLAPKPASAPSVPHNTTLS